MHKQHLQDYNKTTTMLAGVQGLADAAAVLMPYCGWVKVSHNFWSPAAFLALIDFSIYQFCSPYYRFFGSKSVYFFL